MWGKRNKLLAISSLKGVSTKEEIKLQEQEMDCLKNLSKGKLMNVAKILPDQKKSEPMRKRLWTDYRVSKEEKR